jgi:hypothetical protein
MAVLTDMVADVGKLHHIMVIHIDKAIGNDTTEGMKNGCMVVGENKQHLI